MTSLRFKRAAQETKATGLCLSLDAFSAWQGSPVTARDLLGWPDSSWALLAFAARVTMPSVETRTIVIERLCAREALVLAANEGKAR